MEKFLEAVRESLFNLRWKCNICGREIFDGGYFCPSCAEKVVRNDGYICNHCGAPVPYPVEYCEKCKETNLSFDFMRSAYIYGDGVGKLVKNLKYGRRAYVAEILAEEMVELYLKTGYDAEIVVFVPMSKKRERRRGYNQAALLAEAFCKATGVELALDALGVGGQREEQIGLSGVERQRNVKSTFKVLNAADIKGKRVLAIDDVTTTGATMEHLSAALKKCGAESVMCLTAAVTPDKFVGFDRKSRKN